MAMRSFFGEHVPMLRCTSLAAFFATLDLNFEVGIGRVSASGVSTQSARLATARPVWWVISPVERRAEVPTVPFSGGAFGRSQPAKKL
jgi:hypothetical protein